MKADTSMTTTSLDNFNFGGSMGAEKAKEANKGGDFAREVEFLSLKADEGSVAQGKNMVVMRFATDFRRHFPNEPVSKFDLPWITAGQHYAATRPKPDWAKKEARWPEKMSGGCRKDPIFTAAYPSGCLLCQRGLKPSNRTWALGIEREEIVENGQRVGFKDKTREITATDEQGNFIEESRDGDKVTYKKITVPAWTVMNFGWKNLFGPLNGQASYFGTLLDADWLITRTGMGNDDTLYTPVRVGETYLKEGNEYGLPAGTKYDLGMVLGQENGRSITLAEALYPNMPDLRQIIADRVSDEY